MNADNFRKTAHKDRRGFTLAWKCGCKLVRRGFTSNRWIFCDDEDCGSLAKRIPPMSRAHPTGGPDE